MWITWLFNRIKDEMTMTIDQLFNEVDDLISTIMKNEYTNWQNYVFLKSLNQNDTTHKIYSNINAIK